MNLIVAVDENWGIGKKNGLLFNLPKDLAFFKQMTLNKVVCMGYNTLLSFPNGKPLNKRVNIVLCPQDVERDDCICVHDLNALKKVLMSYNDEEVFIIGGGMFYKTMLPYCKKAYVTEVYADGNAEIFFPNLANMHNWSKESISELISDNGINLRFTLYTNNTPEEF